MTRVASKLRRALRNETGVHLTLDELRAFADHGALEIASRAENEELWPAKATNTRSANTGSTSAGTASRPPSGKLPDIPRSLDRSYIAALSASA
jgi:hypothetical protein